MFMAKFPLDEDLCPMLPRKRPSTTALGPVKPTSEEEKPLCKNFLWGKCNDYAQCNFRHVLDTEKMKDILKFCHDYQNKNGCTRENCKFLHTTKEEQNLFLATGQIPRVLAERHAAMAAAASTNAQTNAETIPQIAMFISESYMTQPPPAPWPPLPPPQHAVPPVATAPPPPPASPPRHAAALQPVQASQPPPSATPAPNFTQLRSAPTTYAMPSQTPPALFSLNQPPPPKVPAVFDASRPPPPIPSHLQPSNNGQLKRKIATNGNAATGKIRKPEGNEESESLCENCVQRELRIDGYKLQMEVLNNEEEAQILLYKKKLQEYEIGRGILKTIVGPELFLVFDNLIEGAQTPQLDNPATSFLSGSSTVSKTAVLQLFQMLLSNDTRNVVEPVPSTSHMDDILRRHNAYTHPGPDLIKFVVETLRNSSAPDKSPSVEEPTDMNGTNRSNGYLANGQKQPTSITEPARYGVAAGYSGPARANQEFGDALVPQAVPNYSVAGPSGYAGGAPAPAPPPPAGYAMYHPAIPPPPNRHYYGPSPGLPSAPNRAAGPGPGPGPLHGMPPTSSAVLRPSQANKPNYTYNMGRYPQPPYFPPYQ